MIDIVKCTLQHIHAHIQTSREVGILRELHSEIQSEAEEIHNLTNRVDIQPDDVLSKHLCLLAVQSVVITAVFLVTCLYLCRVNRNLEQKLNTIQTTLSSQNHPPVIPSQLLTSVDVATENAMNNRQIMEKDLEQSCQSTERTKLSNGSQVASTHARSLSFTSVSDIRRQAENIGDLSGVDLKHLTTATTQRRSWRENGRSSGHSCWERETTATLSGAGHLSSRSLSSLDDRRSSAEVSVCSCNYYVNK